MTAQQKIDKSIAESYLTDRVTVTKENGGWWMTLRSNGERHALGTNADQAAKRVGEIADAWDMAGEAASMNEAYARAEDYHSMRYGHAE